MLYWQETSGHKIDMHCSGKMDSHVILPRSDPMGRCEVMQAHQITACTVSVCQQMGGSTLPWPCLLCVDLHDVVRMVLQMETSCSEIQAQMGLSVAMITPPRNCSPGSLKENQQHYKLETTSCSASGPIIARTTNY